MRAILLVLAAVLLNAATAQAEDDGPSLVGLHEEWRDLADALIEGNARLTATAADPLTAAMDLCHESGCTQVGRQALNEAEAGELRALFAAPNISAGEERTLIAHALARMEMFVGGRNGTWRDLPGNSHRAAEETGQLDCIAESVNTLTYLDRLSRAGLLRHHQVGGFIHRYTFVLQHVATEIIERETGERFAVDSWVNANGEDAVVEPYGDWRMGWAV